MTGPDVVECPECNQEFDPMKAAGWCTNPDCGEYKYEQDQAGAAPDSTPSSPQEPDQPHDTAQQAETGGGSGTPDTNQPSQGAAGAGQEDAEQDSSDVVCPDCGDQVPNKNFCLNCGAELSDQEASAGDSSEEPAQQPEPEPEPTQQTADRGDGPQQGGPVDQNPTASGGVDAQGSAGATHEPDPAEHAGGDQPTSTAVQSDTDEHQSPEGTPNTPHTAVIDVGSSHIRLEPGDAAGSEIRSAYVESGGDSTEAQYISREHIRLERQEDELYIEDVSTNGTQVNGETLGEGELHRIEDGDTLNFADVTEASITIERE